MQNDTDTPVISIVLTVTLQGLTREDAEKEMLHSSRELVDALVESERDHIASVHLGMVSQAENIQTVADQLAWLHTGKSWGEWLESKLAADEPDMEIWGEALGGL